MDSFYRRIAGELCAFFRTHIDLFLPADRNSMQRKEDGSQVGEADMMLHQLLSRLVRERSNAPIMSEEGEIAWPPSLGTFWLFDPFDGSNNHASGLPLCGSMVSAFENYQPVMSAIFVPNEERLTGNGFYFATKGGGAWRVHGDQEVRIQASSVSEIEKAAVLIEGPSRKVAADDRVRKLQQIAPWRINLSCALAFTRLASGRTDAVVSVSNKPTDALHGILFAQESGGRVTDFQGQPPSTKNYADLVFTNGNLHPGVLNALHSA